MLSLDTIKKIYALAKAALKNGENPVSWGVVTSDFFSGTHYSHDLAVLRTALDELSLALRLYVTKAAKDKPATQAEPDPDKLVDLNNDLAKFIIFSFVRMDLLSDKAYLFLYQAQALFATETMEACKATQNKIIPLLGHQVLQQDHTATIKKLESEIAEWRDLEKTLQADVKSRAAYRSHCHAVLGSAKPLINQLINPHLLYSLNETLTFAREYARHINIDFETPVSSNDRVPKPTKIEVKETIANLSLITNCLPAAFFTENMLVIVDKLANGELSHADMMWNPSYNKIQELDDKANELVNRMKTNYGRSFEEWNAINNQAQELMNFSYKLFSILSTSTRQRFVEANRIYILSTYSTLLNLRIVHGKVYQQFYSANKQTDAIKALETECQRIIGRCDLLNEEITADEKTKPEYQRKLILLFEIKKILAQYEDSAQIFKNAQTKAQEIVSPTPPISPPTKLSINKPAARRVPAKVSSSPAQLFAVPPTAPVKPTAAPSALTITKP